MKKGKFLPIMQPSLLLSTNMRGVDTCEVPELNIHQFFVTFLSLGQITNEFTLEWKIIPIG